MADNTPFDANDNKALTDTVDPEKNYHEELVGEGKKYKDEQALARSKVEGDHHISQLERELHGIRDELKSRTDMETLVTELKELSTKEVVIVEDPSTLENKHHEEPAKSEQTPEQIEQLVNTLVEKRENTHRLQRNLSEVTDKLSTLWGDKAQKSWVDLREELNMSEQELRDFASTKPEAVLKMAGLVKQELVPPDDSLFSHGNVQLRSLEQPISGVKDQKYYDEIRRRDPDKYHSKELQVEMHKEAQKQQESFFTS